MKSETLRVVSRNLRHFSVGFLDAPQYLIRERGQTQTLNYFYASLVAQMVKNLPAVQETWVRSLCWEDPLEKGMATHSSILVWRIPWKEEPGGLQSVGSQRVRHD